MRQASRCGVITSCMSYVVGSPDRVSNSRSYVGEVVLNGALGNGSAYGGVGEVCWAVGSQQSRTSRGV